MMTVPCLPSQWEACIRFRRLSWRDGDRDGESPNRKQAVRPLLWFSSVLFASASPSRLLFLFCCYSTSLLRSSSFHCLFTAPPIFSSLFTAPRLLSSSYLWSFNVFDSTLRERIVNLHPNIVRPGNHTASPLSKENIRERIQRAKE